MLRVKLLHGSATVLQLASALTTATGPTPGRLLHSSPATSEPPDLYEGSRTDRRPYPSPVPGVTQGNVKGAHSKDLPDDAYPVQDDLATSPSQQHPSEQEAKLAAQQHAPEKTEDLLKSTKATASAGDPAKPVEAARAAQQKQKQEVKQEQEQDESHPDQSKE